MRANGSIVAVVVALALAACGGNEGGHTVASPTTSAAPDSSTTSSAATSRPPAAATFTEVGRADEPVALVGIPGTDRMLIPERKGRVLAFEASDTGLRRVGGSPVLDLSDRVLSDGSEQGLLGLAVDPAGRWLYVDYTAKGGDAGTTTVARYALSGTDVDRGSAETLLRIPQPFSNHNGGSLVIGPDGALYIGMGDGGGQGDPADRAQDPDGRFGRILRLALDGSKPTTWAMGLRNPWRFTVDASTGDLWIGDVGGSEREEVDRLRGSGPGTIGGEGANLGWSRREGSITPDDDEGGRGDPSTFVDPIYDYSHDDGGCSIVGGHVIRSPQPAALEGRYVFGDFCSGEIWALDPADDTVTRIGKVDQLSSFGLDAAGRSYALSLDGAIFRIDAP